MIENYGLFLPKKAIKRELDPKYKYIHMTQEQIVLDWLLEKSNRDKLETFVYSKEEYEFMRKHCSTYQYQVGKEIEEVICFNNKYFKIKHT